MIDDFHKSYVASNPPTTWQDIEILKCPLDLWLYQEIIHRLKPDLIIESGTYKGGSALFLANMCDLIGKGRVVTIDIDHYEGRPLHPRIRYILGSSIEDDVLGLVNDFVIQNPTVMVILDSDHTKAHVLKEMEAYAKFVTKGSYMIVEDTNINGHPVLPDWGEGPMEAVEEFMVTHKEFEEDSSMHKFLLTFNKHGYLKKVS